jgi:two-component system LytT family sensor kinase
MYFYIDNIYNRLYFTTLNVALVASAFYIIYLYIMPAYIPQKNIWKLIGYSTLCLLTLTGFYAWMMRLFLNHKLVPIRFDFSWNYSDLQYNLLFIALLGILAGIFVKLAMDGIEVKRLIETMEKEKSKAELAYLKSQINPHFLFNSLNTIHAQMELGMEESKRTLISFSDLLRYQLYECGNEVISLSKEIDYLRNYLDLQQARLDYCVVTITVEGDSDQLMVAPLLFMPFVENAFKHLSDECAKERVIDIKIDISGKTIKFSCSNTIGKVTPIADIAGGIGLVNVEKRLELIYKDKYTLSRNTSGDVYRIKLTLNL